MSFEPEKFFIGLIDFFAIVLPGALVAYGLMRFGVATWILGEPVDLTGTTGVTMFLIGAYVLGHFVFLLGSFLLDTPYDWLRNCTQHGQLEALSRGKHRAARPWRWLARQAFGNNPDRAVDQAIVVKTRALQPLAAERAVNTFQWCKAWLSKEHPPGLVEVQRFEAHSKFFRSFVIVLVLDIGALVVTASYLPAAACLLPLFLAAWRYLDQRFKATQQAYWHVLTLEAARGTSATTSSARAGGLVQRTTGNRVEYLLVKSSDGTSWGLPKGHVEPGETAARAAVREVLEETGYWARVLVAGGRPARAGVLRYPSGSINIEVDIYLLQLDGDPDTGEREVAWCSADDARIPKETCALIATAATAVTPAAA